MENEPILENIYNLHFGEENYFSWLPLGQILDIISLVPIHKLIQNLPWSKEELMENPSILSGGKLRKMWNVKSNCILTIKDIEKDPNIEFDIWDLSINQHTTIKDVEKHPEIPWDYSGLSINQNTTIKDVEKHPEIEWSGLGLSMNPNITIFDVISHPEIEWRWKFLSIGLNMFPFRENLRDRSDSSCNSI